MITVRLTLAVCTPLAAEPLMVAVAVPSAADALIFSVRVAEPPAVTLAGLPLPVTPEGSPLIAREILWGAPAVTAVAPVTVLLVPRVIDTAVGTAAIAKSLGTGAMTVTTRLVECVPLEAVPLTVALVAANLAFADAVRVSVADPPAVTRAGLTLPVTPAGSPLSANEMLCAAPAVTEVDTVTVRLDPGVSATDVGDTASAKSFALPTTIEMRTAIAPAAENSTVYAPGSEIRRSLNHAIPVLVCTVVRPSRRPGPPINDAVTS